MLYLAFIYKYIVEDTLSAGAIIAIVFGSGFSIILFLGITSTIIGVNKKETFVNIKI